MGLMLPIATVENEWVDRALCPQTDPHLFHLEHGEGNAAAAKRICRACEVLYPCREWALEHDEPHGVWGGMSARERKRERKRRGMEPPDKPRPPDWLTEFCGTRRGYARHRRDEGSPVTCVACTAAESARRSERNAARRAKRKEKRHGSEDAYVAAATA